MKSLIQVRNRGLRHGPEEVLRRIAEGENVDPAEYYFRMAPVLGLASPLGPFRRFNLAHPKLLILKRGCFGLTFI